MSRHETGTTRPGAFHRGDVMKPLILAVLMLSSWALGYSTGRHRAAVERPSPDQQLLAQEFTLRTMHKVNAMRARAEGDLTAAELHEGAVTASEARVRQATAAWQRAARGGLRPRDANRGAGR